MTAQILILDDAESDRDLITTMLSKDGFDSISFYDPQKFKESLNDNVSLIITDVVIPSFDVFKMIEYIHDKFSGINIIVISGHFTDDIYQRLFELGVARVVRKGDGWLKQVSKYVADLTPRMLYKKRLMEI